MMQLLPNNVDRQDQLKDFLDLLMRDILKKTRTNISEEARKNLAKNIAEQLLSGGKSVSLDKLKHPSFVNKLSVALATGGALEVSENKDATNLKDNNKLIDALLPFRKDKNEKQELTPAELARIKQILLKVYMEMLAELKAMGVKNIKTPSPSADKNKKSAEELELEKQFEQHFDKNTNLLGLICMQAGSLAAVVTILLGNLFGIADMNPNDGYAQIDLMKRTDDVAGNYLGTNQEALQEYVALGSVLANKELRADDFVNNAQTAYNNTPKLTPYG